MLNINILEKKFGKTIILKDINIFIEEGELISIIGPSGCGKTTILNIVSGLDTNYIGSLSGDFSKLSFMFQDDRLLPWLNIKDNLLLVSKTKDIEEIEELLSLIGLNHILNEYPNRLSGGMKRRIALIRAFINRPKIIVLDEPFISLDYPTSMALKKDFLIFCKKFNPTVILVTHDLSEAVHLSSRIIFLSSTYATKILDYKNDNNQESDIKKIDEKKNIILDLYPKILEGKI
ncbi:ABC transporter related protein [Arcobacter nitrofigilis DSM 7299]|uniref:ABC transporter related protein n=1 Tax=Arcobacter nitrofigilis (strain ATCC 33309 / DSM 7299 / CCUG 15893 / LMG 7604 / NCTC 12251 / CI) TaxID=572480 RepID=D5V731_ARCNC|nr:ATP-binding cassette domain-containing protein [Arcobacter nitrofigilis]ADG94451.1 ABC transporter related protein [Arcobacter nitrofigilis DSM 7299]